MVRGLVVLVGGLVGRMGHGCCGLLVGGTHGEAHGGHAWLEGILGVGLHCHEHGHSRGGAHMHGHGWHEARIRGAGGVNGGHLGHLGHLVHVGTRHERHSCWVVGWLLRGGLPHAAPLVPATLGGMMLALVGVVRVLVPVLLTVVAGR